MPDYPPDTFAAPFHDAVASQRLTPPGVGGHAIDPGNAAHAVASRLARTRDPRIDPRRTAAVERRIAEASPRAIRLRGSGVATTGQVLSIGLGGPEIGFTWDVRRVNVGPLDYSAGSFPTGVFVVLTITDKTNPADSGYEVVSTTSSYPSEGNWGTEQVQLQGGDKLRLLITGLTTGAIVTAGGMALEYATLPPGVQITTEL